ncbi:hypothetical protein GCM10022224_042990 [Nonomuraea antimicrobica]|uniref:Ig-like domain-containing protein n=2 Tax=Nonomuraea antimicrobica TaxID=561173 RepID=A0ABP7C138_9ACTN
MSVGLARKAAAFGASAAVLATLAAGLVAGPAQAAASATASTATAAKAKSTSKSASKVSVSTPTASTRNYEGGCPVKVNFSAKVKVSLKGKTELAYRWLHGDGSKSKVKVVKLSGKGTKTVTVRQSITFDEDVKGWEALQVLGPKKVTSKKGYFSVSCQEPLKEARTHLDVSVKARAWASPSSYVGPCTPGDKINFVGVIQANRPTWVRYRWVLNGDVVDYGKVKVYDTRKVDFGISPRYSQRGWAQLQIISPDGTSSNRAYYKVWCKDSAPEDPTTKVTASITQPSSTNCRVAADGFIHSTGKGKVRYTWSVNGKSVSSGEVYFDRSGGTQGVRGISEVVSGADTSGGTVTLSITGPDNGDVTTRSYAACQAPTPTPTPTETSSPAPTSTP